MIGQIAGQAKLEITEQEIEDFIKTQALYPDKLPAKTQLEDLVLGNK